MAVKSILVASTKDKSSLSLKITNAIYTALTSESSPWRGVLDAILCDKVVNDLQQVGYSVYSDFLHTKN